VSVAAACEPGEPEGGSPACSAAPSCVVGATEVGTAASADRAHGAAWDAFRARHPEARELDLQLHHLLGASLAELSMAQIQTLQQLQRGLCLQLEEVRVQMARQQERQAVEARLAIEIEKQARVSY
jgi:hypothetical protein